MSHQHSQDDLLNEFLDQLAHDINAPAPLDLDTATADFARRLAISEQTPLASHHLENKIWDQLMTSQHTRLPSPNGHSAHPLAFPKRATSDYPNNTNQPRLKKAITRVAAVIIFLLFGATLITLIQSSGNEPTRTSPINAAGSQSATPTPDATNQFNPEEDGMALPPNQDQAEAIAVGESVTNTIEPGSNYIYVFTAEAARIYTTTAISDQRVSLSHRIINRPAIGGNESGSGGGGGGGGGGSDQDVYQLSTSISVSQASIVWISIQNENPTLPVTYTLTLDQVEFTEIAYGDVVAEHFLPEIGEINLQFEGHLGDIIGIAVESEIDTKLELRDSSGAILSSDDDGGDGLNPEIYWLQLPSDGNYRISVLPFGGGGSAEAQISLFQHTLQHFEDGTANIQLSTKYPANVVTFEGRQGERVQLEAVPLDSLSLTSINVVQDGTTLATMDLLPTSYEFSSGTAGGSSGGGGGSSTLPLSETHEFVVPNDGIVTIFLNTTWDENNAGAHYEYYMQVILNLTRLDEEN